MIDASNYSIIKMANAVSRIESDVGRHMYNNIYI